MRPAIVIFGAAVRPDGRPSGAMRGRVEAALAQSRRPGCVGRAPLFVPTGGQGRFGPAESAVMAVLLRGGGVAAADISEEPSGRNTYRSAEACAALLTRLAVDRVYVATSSYHMRRCVWLLRLHGVRAERGVAAAGPASRRWSWWLYWHLRELPALPVDTAVWALSRLRRLC